MECSAPKTLTFKVSRKSPELITPAAPTPHEFKPLSDIDDQDGIRMLQIPAIAVYEGTPSMLGKDPANIIRNAIAKALVFYYPLAGRLREIATRKLVMECTAEGVLFVEADANVTVHQLSDAGLLPPFPNLDLLLYDFPTSRGIIDSPLLTFQVTRLKCGGFSLAFYFSHVILDAAGILQFMHAISELAMGGEAPSIPPVWGRDILTSRNPPRVSFPHPAYDLLPDREIPVEATEERAFFFSEAHISALRRSLPPHLRSCSNFDLVSSCVWRCRTLALSPNPNKEVRLLVVASVAHLLKNPPLPTGYYGNAIVGALAVSTAQELSENPLHYTVELVRKAKGEVTEEFVKSNVDLLVMRDRPCYALDGTFGVSDLGRLDLEKVEFGWGKPLYNGVAKGGPHPVYGMFSWFQSCKNNKGESGVLVTICLPHYAMEVFTEELKNMVMELAHKTTTSIASAL